MSLKCSLMNDLTRWKRAAPVLYHAPGTAVAGSYGWAEVDYSRFRPSVDCSADVFRTWSRLCRVTADSDCFCPWNVRFESRGVMETWS